MFSDYIICLQSQIDSESNWSSTFGMIGQFFLLIIVFAIVLFLAYFSTRWIASVKMGQRKNTMMKIISTMPIGGTNSIQIIQVGERFFLIGVSKDNISYLTELTDVNISQIENNQVKLPFEKYFSEYINKLKNNDKKSE